MLGGKNSSDERHRTRGRIFNPCRTKLPASDRKMIEEQLGRLEGLMHSSQKGVLPFAILPLTILACAARCHAVPRGSFAISFANSLRSCLLTSPSGHIRHEPLVSFSRGLRTLRTSSPAKLPGTWMVKRLGRQFVKLTSGLWLLFAATLIASPVLAADVSSQPLARADCDKAGLTWNDNANVCGSDSEQGARPSFEEAEASSQPLTRVDCDTAGMTWNENANVCGSESEALNSAPEAVMAEILGQPLTRAACDKARLAWNETANVCGPESDTSSEAASEAGAAETPGQPLTRADCDKASMTWSDSANVCGVSAGAIAATSEQATTAEMPGQPLTRADCKKAGRAWNDRANVCGVASEKAKAAVAPVAAPNAAAKAGKIEPKAESAKQGTNKQKKRYTHRRWRELQPSQPAERPFRLFRNQNRSGGGG